VSVGIVESELMHAPRGLAFGRHVLMNRNSETTSLLNSI